MKLCVPVKANNANIVSYNISRASRVNIYSRHLYVYAVYSLPSIYESLWIQVIYLI